MPAGTYWNEAWLKVPFMVSGWGPRPPSVALSVAYRKEANWNETHWFRDDYDALLDRAGAILDDADSAPARTRPVDEVREVPYGFGATKRECRRWQSSMKSRR